VVALMEVSVISNKIAMAAEIVIAQGDLVWITIKKIFIRVTRTRRTIHRIIIVIKTNPTKINIQVIKQVHIRITMAKNKANRMTRTTKISTQTQTTTIRMDMVMINLTIKIQLTNNLTQILIIKTQMEALLIMGKKATTTIQALIKRILTALGVDTKTKILTAVAVAANMEETKAATLQRTTMRRQQQQI